MQLFKRYRLLWLILVTLLDYCALSAAQAQNENPEYQIKAAFLYQFASYVEWPAGTFENAESPLIFGVMNSQAMYNNLLALTANQTIKGRPIEIQALEADSEYDQLHILFAGQPEPDSSNTALDQALASALAHSILIVTETPSLNPGESMINFSVVDNRVKFDIALAPAERAGLKLSARLLQVAQRVVTEP